MFGRFKIRRTLFPRLSPALAVNSFIFNCIFVTRVSYCTATTFQFIGNYFFYLFRLCSLLTSCVETLSDKRSSKSFALKKSQLKIPVCGKVDRKRMLLRCIVYIDEKYLAGNHVLYSYTRIRLYIHLPFSLKRHPRPSYCRRAISSIYSPPHRQVWRALEVIRSTCPIYVY